MEKQTPVEWLALRYHHRQGYLSQDDIAEAKSMEKEQIEQAFIDGDGGYSPDNGNVERMAHDYYNKTFNK
jgi:hypothetical protein